MQDREIWATAQQFVRRYGQAAIFEAMRLAHCRESGEDVPPDPVHWRMVALAARQWLDTPVPGQRPH
ncbi:MAG TPA: hypothetical protein VK943_13150 [Arenibaculum sp.]|nr:hypothetical protein [Arenibaculum sp.]